MTVFENTNIVQPINQVSRIQSDVSDLGRQLADIRIQRDRNRLEVAEMYRRLSRHQKFMDAFRLSCVGLDAWSMSCKPKSTSLEPEIEKMLAERCLRRRRMKVAKRNTDKEAGVAGPPIDG